MSLDNLLVSFQGEKIAASNSVLMKRQEGRRSPRRGGRTAPQCLSSTGLSVPPPWRIVGRIRCVSVYMCETSCIFHLSEFWDCLSLCVSLCLCTCDWEVQLEKYFHLSSSVICHHQFVICGLNPNPT